MASISSSEPSAISRQPSAVGLRSAFARDAGACALLVLLAVGFAWQVTLLGYLPNSTDFILQYYPNLAFLGQSLRAGEIPLWNPLLFAGTPYLADPQSQLLYFPDWPFLLLLDTTSAARGILLAHFALAAVAMYGYLRTVRLPRRPAFLGAMLYGLGPYAFQLVSWAPMLQSLAWMPLVLLLVELALRRRSAAYAALAALALALQFFNGWPHGSYVTAFALLATFAWHAVADVVSVRSWRPLISICLVGALTGLLATAFSAPVWLPFLEYWGHSTYIGERGLEAASEGNVTLLALLGVGGSEGHGAYVGVAALVLALLGVVLSRDRKRVLLYAAIGLFGLLVALGASTPLYGSLYQWVPGFRTFHMPGRFIALYVLAVAVLAAMGADALLKLPGRRMAVTASISTLLLLGAFSYGLTRTLGPDAPSLLANNLLRPEMGPYLNPAMAGHIGIAGIAAVAFLLALASGRLPRTAAFYLALVLVAGDLLLFQGKDARYFSRLPAILRHETPIPAIERLTGQTQDYRITGFQQNGTIHFMSDFPSNLNSALVPPNISLREGLRGLEGYLPMQLRRYADYIAAVNGGTQDYHWALIQNFNTPLLDMLNLGYVAVRDNDARLRQVTIASNQELSPSHQLVTVLPAPILSGALLVHSYLGSATGLEDGRVVARLRVIDTAGQATSFELRAGIETAEWAYDRPEVAAKVRHQRPPITLTRNLPASTHVYEAQFSFPRPVAISRVEVEQTEPDVAVTVQELIAVPANPIDRYERVGEMDGATLYRNRFALPRVLMVPQAEWAATPDEALQRLQAPGFDPRREVVLEGPDRPAITVAGTGEPGHAEVVGSSNNEVRVSTEATSPGFLLLNELSYPGWNAYLDGVRVEVWRANYLFRAIEVPPGEHYVEFRFEPDSLKWGLALSLSTVTLLLMATAALRLKSRQQRKESTPL